MCQRRIALSMILDENEAKIKEQRKQQTKAPQKDNKEKREFAKTNSNKEQKNRQSNKKPQGLNLSGLSKFMR